MAEGLAQQGDLLRAATMSTRALGGTAGDLVCGRKVWLSAVL